MKNDLIRLTVDMLIVHDVPKKFSHRFTAANPDTNPEEVILSDAPTAFDQELTRFFHDRIVSTIGSSSSFEVEFDDNNESEVKDAVTRYFSNDIPHTELENCISITQDIARKLHAVQSARNPGGILLFIPCHNSLNYGLAILKVEREEGVRIQQASNETGQTVFNMQHIKDLILNKKTKLFKIVLFYKDAAGDISGYLCDQQQGVNANREIAEFFLKDFLGCKLKEEPHITTKKFFEATIQFINETDIPPEKKVEAHTHLISELTNNTSAVNALDFANRVFPQEKIQDYMNMLETKKVSQSFLKDILLVQDKIKKIQYDFESGIKLIGTEETVRQKLTFSSLENGESKIEFIDMLKRVQSK